MKGGGVRHLLPSWSPASCSLGSHLGGTRSHPHPRATIKAHPTPSSTTLAPTARPASCLPSRLGFMPMRADYELSQTTPAIHDVGHPYTVLPVILSASFGSLRQSRQILSAAKDDRP